MPDPDDIPAWLRLDHQLTTSGQPSEEQLGRIAALGICHVVNLALHTHPQALPDEGASVAALGMSYTHIPVAFDNPTEQDFTRFCAAMASFGNDPVHVHCIINARVSAFLFRYRRDVLGIDPAQARAALTMIWEPDGVWAAFVGGPEIRPSG